MNYTIDHFEGIKDDRENTSKKNAQSALITFSRIVMALENLSSIDAFILDFYKKLHPDKSSTSVQIDRSTYKTVDISIAGEKFNLNMVATMLNKGATNTTSKENFYYSQQLLIMFTQKR